MLGTWRREVTRQEEGEGGGRPVSPGLRSLSKRRRVTA
jgi:hypothetical protein